MTTILYEINEDSSVTPPTYYPTVVIRAEIGTYEIAEKINILEPTMSPGMVVAILEQMRTVFLRKLSTGYFIELEDFFGMNTDFDQPVDEYPDTPPNSTLIIVGYATDSYTEEVESISEFELYRYTFPKKPFIKLTYDYPTNYPDYIQDMSPFYIEGYDFGIISDDVETGVWLTTPADNNYKQERISYIVTNTIIITPILTAEAGPAGPNSVELVMTIRGRYGEGLSIAYSNQYRIRKKNIITFDHKEIMLNKEQSGGVCNIFGHTYGVGDEVRVVYGDLGMRVIDDSGAGDLVEIPDNGAYALESNSGKTLSVEVENLTLLNDNLFNYQDNFIQEVVSLNEIFISFRTIMGLSEALQAYILKTGDNVNWDLGNGDQVLDQNFIDYSGYADSSEKTVTIFSLDDINTITVMDIGLCKVTSDLATIALPPNLEDMSFANNQITGNIPDLSSLTNIVKIYLDRNLLTGAVPDLSANVNLERLYLYSNSLSGELPSFENNTALKYVFIQDNQFTGPIPSIDNCSQMIEFYCNNNQFTGEIPSLTNNSDLYHMDLSHNFLSGEIPDMSSLVVLEEFEANDNNITSYSSGVDSLISIGTFALHNNNLTSLAISDMVDDFYLIKGVIGSGGVLLRFDGVNCEKPDADALAKINGTGPYAGNGLIELGGRILYSDVLDLKTTNDGTSAFVCTITKTGLPVSWEMGRDVVRGTVIQDSNTANYSGYTDDTEKNVRIANIDDYSSITKIDANNADLTSLPDFALLTAFQEINASGNNLSGEVPDFSSVPTIQRINLPYNQLSSFTTGNLDCPNIAEVYLDHNSLDQEAISSIIDDLYPYRANAFILIINGTGNGIPDANAIAKIEGTGDYVGEGLEDYYCYVEYNT